MAVVPATGTVVVGLTSVGIVGIEIGGFGAGKAEFFWRSDESEAEL